MPACRQLESDQAGARPRRHPLPSVHPSSGSLVDRSLMTSRLSFNRAYAMLRSPRLVDTLSNCTSRSGADPGPAPRCAPGMHRARTLGRDPSRFGSPNLLLVGSNETGQFNEARGTSVPRERAASHGSRRLLRLAEHQTQTRDAREHDYPVSANSPRDRRPTRSASVVVDPNTARVVRLPNSRRSTAIVAMHGM